MRKHFRVPPFAKNAKDGAPILSVMPAKSKAWANPPPMIWTMAENLADQAGGPVL